MRHSIYITLATWFIGADIRHKERAFQRKLRRTANDIPWHSEYLLRDIGILPDGQAIGDRPLSANQVERRLYHLRRFYRLRIPT
ncbi:DUF1127 domain-containing protein [Vibrio sp. RC27]